MVSTVIVRTASELGFSMLNFTHLGDQSTDARHFRKNTAYLNDLITASIGFIPFIWNFLNIFIAVGKIVSSSNFFDVNTSLGRP